MSNNKFIEDYSDWISNGVRIYFSFIAVKVGNNWMLRHTWLGFENLRTRDIPDPEFDIKTSLIHMGMVTFKATKRRAISLLKKFISEPSPTIFGKPDYRYTQAITDYVYNYQ